MPANIFQKLRETINKSISKPNWTGYELKCRITDLEWKWYFISRSIKLFNQSYLLEDDYRKTTGSKTASNYLMDCYMYFELFLFESKSFLDLLSGLYPRFIAFKGKSPRRSFSDFREWVCKKASSQSFPGDIIDFFTRETSWFPLLKDYRDMLAHTQGYNPMVGRNKDGKLLLQICTIEPSISENPHIGDVIFTIQNGLEALIGFSDAVLSKYAEVNLKRFDNDSIGVLSIVDEDSGRKVKMHLKFPGHITLDSSSEDVTTSFQRIRINDMIDTDLPFEEMVKLVISEFESIGISVDTE
jgi:hypothetical protein